jgi:hypothetical protein
MKKLGTLLLIGSAVGVLMVGCSSDEGDSGGAGSGGKGGANAGKGGAGGKSGGAGGKAMSSGGKATGGKSGAGGNAGSGGDAGECTVEEVTEHPLGTSCDFTNPDGHSTVDTTCSFVDTCAALGCGTPFGAFDASGCLRPQCDSSDECASGERCVPSVLHGNECYSSVYEGCEAECNRCGCSWSEDCAQVAYCLDADDYPPSAECDLSEQGCSGLSSFVNELERTEYEGDTADAVMACRSKVLTKLADCNGQGGNGGQGGNAGAGGESGHAGLSGHGGA